QRLESTARETNDWFQQWDRRWQTVRRAVVRAQLQSPSTDGQASLAELQALDEDREKIIADLGVTPPAIEETADLPAFWRYTVPRGELACRTLVQGSNALQVVDYPAAVSSSTAVGRWVLGLVLAVGGIALLFGRYWLPATDWPLRSSRAIGVLVGIA